MMRMTMLTVMMLITVLIMMPIALRAASKAQGPGGPEPSATPPGGITTVVTSIAGSRGRRGASPALSSLAGVGGEHHRHCHY